MKVVIAPDSYKESLSSREAAAAIARGFRTVYPDAELVEIPIADGGEGTLQLLLDALGGEEHWVDVEDPLGRTIRARYGSFHEGKSAVIEMAEASGLERLSHDERDPWHTSSFGTGQLIRAAIDAGATRIIVTLGGSATVDGGLGALTALGFRCLDAHSAPVPRGARGLALLDRIEAPSPPLPDLSVSVACDVESAVRDAPLYAEQKGLNPNDRKDLDSALRHFAKHIDAYADAPISFEPGSGAAGALGAGLATLLGGALEPGFVMLQHALDLESQLQGAKLLITGEGEINHQSALGKAPTRMAQLAKEQKIPVIAIAGAVNSEGPDPFDARFSITPRPASLEESLTHAAEWLEARSREIAHTLKVGQQL